MTPMGTPPAGTNNTGMQTLGRYTLVREIARSNDIVWEGIDPRMNRRVAVKELNLPTTLTGQPRRDRIERFFREARAAGAMNHANIVTIHEVGEDHGRYFIAMEYLEGTTLRERLSLVRELPLREAINIAYALCDALAFAHSRGVVHRDIKPENVHILTDGRVKLTDFGIARITHETQLTVAGQVFGTPSYMSPEQVLGKEIDYRSDIFSLGVMLYEMVTGRRPFTFDGDSVVTITYRIMNDATPVAVGVSPVLNSIIQRATAKAPAGRYQTAMEFGTALLAAQNSVPASDTTIRTGASGFGDRTVVYGAQTQMGGAPNLVTGDDWARQPAGSPPLAASPLSPARGTAVPTLASNLPPMVPMAPNARPASTSRIGALVAAAIALVVVFTVGTFWFQKAYANFVQGSKSADYALGYKQAFDLYSDSRFEEAAGRFRQIRLAPAADSTLIRRATEGETYAYRRLGQNAQKQNDLLAAQHWFQEALKVSPDDIAAREELEGVQSRLSADSRTAIPNAVTQDHPLDPASPQVAAASTPKPSSLPGNVSTNDFQNMNGQMAMQAQQLLDQGIEAYNKGNTAQAQQLWLDAVRAGPGSQPAKTAIDYVNRMNKGQNPLGPDSP